LSKRHIIFYKTLRPFVALFLKCKFGYKYQKAKNLPDNYIVLSNHATDYDPLFVGVSFSNQMYFVASEHIARWKFVYKLIDFFLAPITRYKGSVATSTVVDVLRKVKKGANVCIFAEGDRTWDGVTRPIAPSTAKLIKNSGCGLVTYKLTGGYFVSPRWSNKLRRGPISGAPVNIYTKEDLSKMSTDEIYQIITRDLFEDAYKKQLEQPKRYRSKAPAEGMEHLLFICPKCGARDSIHTKGNTVTCSKCNMNFTYDHYGMLSGLELKTVRELSLWQEAQVHADVTNHVTYTASDATFAEVTNHQETLLATGTLSISAGGICCGDINIPLDDISDMALYGKRGIVFSAGKKYYEAKPAPGNNGLKFTLYYDAYKMIKEKDGQ